MKNLFYKYGALSLIACGCALTPFMLQATNKNVDEKVSDRQSYKIYVDDKGVMRRNDTKEEVSYYGTNYTLPFAHAYRALGYLGKDRKEAIQRDVYHMKHLGFNGFRLHLWDVEIADSAGNLLSNDHLDLLDYLIAQLEDNGIDIILTAQTNFGNGYPEKNIDTGSFTYDFDKCKIHEDKKAQKIQENYLRQLAEHVNPYTGMSYGGDNAIIAMEINNEPCHSGSKKEVTAYINKMVKALKKGGFDKPILYNVSHNPEVTEAYYEADIDGTTYQWYPTGLVAGHQRKGNFLPAVDEYNIPWKDQIKNYDKLARVVYEFDPGDVLYSYLYPAIARTYRKEGFQWITQFAYDPTDIAKYNTEYQTHFLNLAYTPSKALSMLIAGEAAREIPRGTDYGTYPDNTTFGDFLVSYENDLSIYNSNNKFYYSNSTTEQPKSAEELQHVAGVGKSNVVDYEGTGAYFLDATDMPGVWRLEVMPDIILTSDPFEKPSLNKEIGKIVYKEQPITINLPALGKNFTFQGIDKGNKRSGFTDSGSFEIYPGIYLISKSDEILKSALNDDHFLTEEMAMFVAPSHDNGDISVIHTPQYYIDKEKPLVITAEIFGENTPEKVEIYPSYISFWNDNNTIIPMKKTGPYSYTATIEPTELGWGSDFSYNIVVTENGKDNVWPSGKAGNPLDWDYTNNEYYTTRKVSTDDAVILLSPAESDRNLETVMIPEAWDFRLLPQMNYPIGNNSYLLTSSPENDGKIIIRRYVGDELNNAPQLADKNYIIVRTTPFEGMEETSIALVGKNGATYSAPLDNKYKVNPSSKLHQDLPAESSYFKIPVKDLKQTATNIVPAPFPSFLQREINIGEMPFDIKKIDYVEMTVPTVAGKEIKGSIEGIWLAN